VTATGPQLGPTQRAICRPAAGRSSRGLVRSASRPGYLTAPACRRVGRRACLRAGRPEARRSAPRSRRAGFVALLVNSTEIRCARLRPARSIVPVLRPAEAPPPPAVATRPAGLHRSRARWPARRAPRFAHGRVPRPPGRFTSSSLGPARRCASRRAQPAVLTSSWPLIAPSCFSQAAHPATGRSRSRARFAELRARSVLAFGCAPHAACGLSLDRSLDTPCLVRGTAKDSGERWFSRPITS
jgi:hypothetical protein